MFGMIFDGRNAHLSDGVQRAWPGPRDFSDYARAAAATGVWKPCARRELTWRRFVWSR
jgi:hypothetical protein